jgi:hypothetical protein
MIQAGDEYNRSSSNIDNEMIRRGSGVFTFPQKFKIDTGDKLLQQQRLEMREKLLI